MVTNTKARSWCRAWRAELDPARIQGRIILMQSVNIPAAFNNTRLSPIDNRDLNRCFPAIPRARSPRCSRISSTRSCCRVSMCRSTCTRQGHSADAALSTNMHYLPDAAMRQRTLDAAAAFGAPFNVMFWGVDEGATLTSSVERRGILSIGTEIGGWGRVSVEGVRIGARGALNVLKHFGVVDGKPETKQRDGSAGTRHMMVRDPACYSFVSADGLFEPCHVAGDDVREGETAGWLHFIEDIDRKPIEIRYGKSGVLWMAAGPGRVQRGDRRGGDR